MYCKLLFLALIIQVKSFPITDTFPVSAPSINSAARKIRTADVSAIKDLVDAGAKAAYIHSYDNGDDNEKAYYKATSGNGNEGYKHYDSFHKKDGDKYGYETHSAYGKYAYDDNEANGKNEKYKDNEENASLENEEQAHDVEDVDETRIVHTVVKNPDDCNNDGNCNRYRRESEHNSGYFEGDDSGAYNDNNSYKNRIGDHYEEGNYNFGYDDPRYNSEEKEGVISALSSDNEEFNHYLQEDDTE